MTNDDDFDGMLVAIITAFCGVSNDPAPIPIEFFMVIEDIEEASNVYGIG